MLALAAAHSKKESLVTIFDNVLIPKSKNMAKSMAGFSQKPRHTFCHVLPRFHKRSAGVDMAPCRSVPIFNQEAGVFLRESPQSALQVESV